MLCMSANRQFSLPTCLFKFEELSALIIIITDSSEKGEKLPDNNNNEQEELVSVQLNGEGTLR